MSHGKFITELKAKRQMDPLTLHGRKMASTWFKIKVQMEITDLVLMRKN